MSNPQSPFSLDIKNLSYAFPNKKVGLSHINLQIPHQSKVLLVGPNGAGKSTLLKVLSGQKLVKEGSVLVNGHDPFELGATSIPGVVTYLGTEWANNEIVKRDVPVTVLVASVGGDDYAERRDHLVDILDIDVKWRMNQCSDGERRRVQLCMGLLKPWDLLLLDEVTIDLDVLVRSRLLEFLTQETETRKATVVYATHIFDGLANWPTRVVHLRGGQLVDHFEMSQIQFTEPTESFKTDPTVAGNQVRIPRTNSLHPLALHWLTKDLKDRGERSEDKTRPRWNDQSQHDENVYYRDSESITSYFKTTRTVR
ncbi:CCR4-NOT regulatory complex component [Komagataella phaffii CBS 7435]|uniref:Part of the evolutionarily-conserved CCR4-NOT transcriptional regulatory complex n=2 Tax=Komagataella phaffii TaxID=460519 RepID=C4QY86_KOMPG|nr:uncharacterized protein PAS_chr1-4_0366 [Komagataella phaffii GS115]AOA61812.1 GQ67_01802T0 [Komagataella phaffii]CAH2447031.1 CCR4-NOT regulatory complex component [Komagataella phaffii CBS 7435]AOA65774.1 GQ68_01817T0 [Komagataella phaffii GS115]CAY68209.1 Part of the evolutionarily-conserved CCR4-NOT transcriptional regulatory complex [Komagataella phaffii GS115]SCV11902.1 CCR4-NOT regulatory complex component [Komagataella phaffii CBS 7435]